MIKGEILEPENVGPNLILTKYGLYKFSCFLIHKMEKKIVNLTLRGGVRTGWLNIYKVLRKSAEAQS